LISSNRAKGMVKRSAIAGGRSALCPITVSKSCRWSRRERRDELSRPRPRPGSMSPIYPTSLSRFASNQWVSKPPFESCWATSVFPRASSARVRNRRVNGQPLNRPRLRPKYAGARKSVARECYCT
jgi:hypothetical protein